MMISKKKLVALFLVLSFLGFIDSSFLTAKHYQDSPVPCLVFNDCDKVLTSRYATVGNIPVSLLGALFYLAIIVLTVAYLDAEKDFLLYLVSLLSILGFLLSLWFVYLQIFVIKAICPYCLVSAATSTALFILGVGYLGVTISKGRSWPLKRNLPEITSK